MKRALEPGLALLLIALLHVGAGAVVGVGLADDAYIFLRYADNLALGHGLVFNPGERVEGYTSPLWMALTAAVPFLPLDAALATRALSSLCGIAAVFIFYGSLRRFFPAAGVWLPLSGALALTLDPAFTFWTASGMETALAALTLTLAATSFMEAAGGRTSMLHAGAFLALAALTRPEALILYPFLILLCPRGRRFALLLPAAALVLHLVARFYYYGSVLPNTYFAKTAVSATVRAAHGAAYAGRFALAYAPLLAALLVVALIVWRRGHRLDAAARPAIAVVVLWSLAVVWEGGDHFPLFRFFVPVMPLLIWLLVALLASLMSPAPHARASAHPIPGTRVILVSCLVLAGFVGQGLAVFRFHEGARARGDLNVVEAWKEVGLWLRQTVPADTSVAAVGIGAVGYYSRLRIVDLLGLTDAVVARQGLVQPEAMIGHQRYHTDHILTLRPHIILFVTAGWFDRPSEPWTVPAGIKFHYALRHLVQDPRVPQWYETASFRMDNGRYAEFLILKEERWRLTHAGP